MQDYYISDFVKVVFLSPNDDSYWFGYYNYCPISFDGERLLAHRFLCEEEKDFEQEDVIEIGWFSLEDHSWHKVATTHAANWQQGAMAQWLLDDGQECIIFNDADGDKYVSKIATQNGVIKRQLPCGIYGINHNQAFSITLNFERAYWCRTYHYQYIRKDCYDVSTCEVDGIYKLDISTGKLKKIISIEDIIQYDSRDNFAEGKHWVEHIMLNPSGTRFAFYHRFDLGDGYQTRCFTANIDGEELYCLPGWEENNWSHLGWKNNEEFVLFGVKRKKLGEAYSKITQKTGTLGGLLRKIYRKVFARFVTPQMHNKLAASSNYQCYIDKQGKVGCYEKDLLVHDGHPSFTADERYMLSDTYAIDGYRYLYIYDTKTNRVYELGHFFSPVNGTGYRCDLHPRFSRDERHVIIDTAFSGKHNIMVLEIDWKHIKGDK